ncbi:LYR motif-containing protein 1 isoform X3 [Pteropus alecto]|uniref:LYR motif-containing protein 1 isoform X3 n=1 Tax=Pteropus alecto TaxID=9402 RepID=UPI000D5366EA|nr:LYR motif-containing protein 1 isoform X3 [Pteropus alecto]
MPPQRPVTPGEVVEDGGPAPLRGGRTPTHTQHHLLLVVKLSPPPADPLPGLCPQMTTATRQEVLGLYRRIFRLARKWQAASGQMEDTIKEKQYILNEARTLFQKNKNCSVLHRGRTPSSACARSCSQPALRFHSSRTHA